MEPSLALCFQLPLMLFDHVLQENLSSLLFSHHSIIILFTYSSPPNPLLQFNTVFPHLEPYKAKDESLKINFTCFTSLSFYLWFTAAKWINSSVRCNIFTLIKHLTWSDLVSNDVFGTTVKSQENSTKDHGRQERLEELCQRRERTVTAISGHK